ncbi:hypothetical protein AGMMS49525_17940 [Bacteroidia bacterium]|nr:hypothetical protein AGMMS49525_17940 [Bacteroidia bacterium]
MKQIFILSFAAFVLCVGSVRAQETGLIVHETTGATSSFALSGIDKITFSGGDMKVVPTSGSSSDIALSAISQLTFGAVAPTEIAAVDISALKLYPNPVRDELFVTSDTEMESIALFNLSGSLMLRTTLRALTAKLSIGFLPSGTYLIQIKRADTIETHKIIKL